MLAFLPHVDPNVSVLIANPDFSRALSILANGLFFVNSAQKQCQYTPTVYENIAQTQGYSQFSTVVRPLKECLSLTRATCEIARSAMPHHLCNMSPHRSPPSNLSRIILVPTTTIVSAIPLKPPARIIRVNPSFLSPHRERLTRINPKVIQLWIAFAGCEFRMRKPTLRKFLRTVSHIHPAKHTERKHIFRRKIGCKRRIKMLPLRFGEFVSIVALHSIVNRNTRSHKMQDFLEEEERLGKYVLFGETMHKFPKDIYFSHRKLPFPSGGRATWQDDTFSVCGQTEFE